MRKLIATILGTFLCSCSSGRLDELERKMNSGFAELRSNQAQQTEEIRLIQEEFNRTKGKIDELQFETKGRAEEFRRSIEQFQGRMPPPPGIPSNLLTMDEQAIAPLASPAAEKFRSALKAIRLGQFDVASQSFAEFASENPNTAFTDNAYFWVGIAETSLGRYDRAVVAFNDAATRFPAEDRVPAALYGLANAFAKMGSTKESRATLEKLAEDYPRTDYGAKAREQLRGGSAGRGR